MPSIKFSPDTVTAYKLHQRALAESRSIADVVKRMVERDLSLAPVATPDAVDKQEIGDKRVVGAYLNGVLADAIEHIAQETGRSKSHVLRGLVRDSLESRGFLPPSNKTSFIGTAVVGQTTE